MHSPTLVSPDELIIAQAQAAADLRESRRTCEGRGQQGGHAECVGGPTRDSGDRRGPPPDVRRAAALSPAPPARGGNGWSARGGCPALAAGPAEQWADAPCVLSSVFPFYRWENRSPERRNNLPKVTQLVWCQSLESTRSGRLQAVHVPPVFLECRPWVRGWEHVINATAGAGGACRTAPE